MPYQSGSLLANKDSYVLKGEGQDRMFMLEARGIVNPLLLYLFQQPSAPEVVTLQGIRCFVYPRQ